MLLATTTPPLSALHSPLSLFVAQIPLGLDAHVHAFPAASDNDEHGHNLCQCLTPRIMR